MADDKKGEVKSPPHLERNTLTVSILVTILGLICLPNVEWKGSTWYVLMLVFIGNAAIIIWVLARLFLRKRRGEREG